MNIKQRLKKNLLLMVVIIAGISVETTLNHFGLFSTQAQDCLQVDYWAEGGPYGVQAKYNLTTHIKADRLNTFESVGYRITSVRTVSPSLCK